MAYLDVLPLADMKSYLRIDDTQNDTDAEITSMIKSALKYIEDHTNVMLYDRDKEYEVRNGCVYVYEHPINSVVKGIDDDGVDVTLTYKTNYTYTKKARYTLYEGIDVQAVTFVANVGYDDPANVPTDLVDLAKVIVKIMFYEQESNESFIEMLPAWAKHILETNRRFII